MTTTSKEFRTFTEHDWDAFQGCESDQPWIWDDSDDLCVVIDGAQLCINVNHFAGEVGKAHDQPIDIEIYAADYSSRDDGEAVAKTVARELVAAYTREPAGITWRHLLHAIAGEPVGYL